MSVGQICASRCFSLHHFSECVNRFYWPHLANDKTTAKTLLCKCVTKAKLDNSTWWSLHFQSDRHRLTANNKSKQMNKIFFKKAADILQLAVHAAEWSVLVWRFVRFVSMEAINKICSVMWNNACRVALKRTLSEQVDACSKMQLIGDIYDALQYLKSSKWPSAGVSTMFVRPWYF